MRVVLHEGSIGLPHGFEDRTVNIFVPANTQVQPNLSIARDWLREDETLSSYVDRQLATLRSQFAGHKLIDRLPCTLGSGDKVLQGERIDDSYKNGKLTIYKRQAAFLVDSNPPDDRPGRRALILTANTARGFTDAFEALWKHWLLSYVPPTPGATEARNAVEKPSHG
jgi:hypothetical protein